MLLIMWHLFISGESTSWFLVYRLKADIDRIKLENDEAVQQMNFKHSNEVKVLFS